MFWVARWLSGQVELDLVLEAPDQTAAIDKADGLIKASGYLPTVPVILAPLVPMKVDVKQFSSIAAMN